MAKTNDKGIISHEELRQKRIEQLAHMRHIERCTLEECAQRLGVSKRTVQNYLADEDYEQTVQRLRKEWKEGAITHVAELAQTALTTMKDLMGPETKSEHVRFEAAKAIGDWLGLGQLEQAQQQDDHGEMERLQRLLAQRPVQITNIYPVEPGGLLPAAIRGKDVDVNELVNKLRGAPIVEGTIVE